MVVRLYPLVLCIVLMLLSSCRLPANQPDSESDDYAVYSAYLNRFQFYRNVPRQDPVFINDSTWIDPAVRKQDIPWSWVANHGDRCTYSRNKEPCTEVHSQAWEPLLAGIQQLRHRPGHKLTAHFNVSFTTRLVSATQINQPDFLNRLNERDPVSGRAAYVFSLSPVVYNQERTKALFFGSFFCGGTCGRGELVMLKKVDQNWVLIDTFRFWIA